MARELIAGPCPCCGYPTMNPEEFPGTYNICPICGWEDDPDQFEDPSLTGGANEVSLIQARINFKKFGASMERRIDLVRKKCACCGLLTVDSIELPEGICPTCRWKIDDWQTNHPDLDGGTNGISLNQARENFNRFGASREEYINDVRKPYLFEIPGSNTEEIPPEAYFHIMEEPEIPDGDLPHQKAQKAMEKIKNFFNRLNFNRPKD